HQPEKAGQESKLRSQHRPKQRTCASNRREVMAEQHVLIGGMKIDAVVQPHSRRHTLVVKLHNPPRNPTAIKTIREHINTSRRDDQPEPIHFFLWIDKPDNKGKCNRAKNGKKSPKHQL